MANKVSSTLCNKWNDTFNEFITSTSLSYKLHPEAVYTSRLLVPPTFHHHQILKNTSLY